MKPFRPLRLALAVGLPLWLAACATPGRPGAPPAVAAPAAWNHAQPVAATPSRWWQTLDDAALDALVARAVQEAPDLQTAQTRLREARARVTIARADGLPTVSGSASATRSRGSNATGSGATRNLFDVGLDASWEADLFGRVAAGADAAVADLATAEANLGDARLTLQAEVALDYLAWRSAVERLAIARSNLSRQEETQRIAQWRLQAGLASSLDVEQARSSTEQTRAQAAGLEDTAAQAQLALELLLGAAPGSLQATLANANAPLQTPAPAGLALPADVLRQRPDVRAAASQWQAEAARSSKAEAATRPQLKLSGSIGLQALTLGALKDGLAGSLAAALVAPIFDGGSLRAQLEAQTAVQERAAIAYRKTVLTAFSEVEGALGSLAALRQQGAALANAAEAARNAALLARQRYDSGLVDFRTVLDAERSALSLEDSLASTRSEAFKAWVRLFKALGGADEPANT